MLNHTDLKDCTLTVGVKNIALVSESKKLSAGKIYNITRSVAAKGHELSASAVGEIVGSDGMVYAVADKDYLPSGVTAVAMIAYLGKVNDTYNGGLAISLNDEDQTQSWSKAMNICNGKTAVPGGDWLLPRYSEWYLMFSANGGNQNSYTGLNSAITAAGGKALQAGQYWTSSYWVKGKVTCMRLNKTGNVDHVKENQEYGWSYWVRASLAF